MIRKVLHKVLLLFFCAILLGGTLETNKTLAQQITDPALVPGNISAISNNWAGYIAKDGTFTSVKGSWTVPMVSGQGISADAIWVGIGGVTKKDLIQAGTQAIISNNGQVSYQAWYEMLPATSHKVSLTVNPGDSITASVEQTSANRWTISIRNNTTGQNYLKTVNYVSSLSSAEWVQEMPVLGRAYIPLDNFGSVKFTDLATAKNGVSMAPDQAAAYPITMINHLGQTLVQTSPLDTNGTGFTVTRTSAISVRSAFSPEKNGWRKYIRPFHWKGLGIGRPGDRFRFSLGLGKLLGYIKITDSI